MKTIPLLLLSLGLLPCAATIPTQAPTRQVQATYTTADALQNATEAYHILSRVNPLCCSMKYPSLRDEDELPVDEQIRQLTQKLRPHCARLRQLPPEQLLQVCMLTDAVLWQSDWIYTGYCTEVLPDIEFEWIDWGFEELANCARLIKDRLNAPGATDEEKAAWRKLLQELGGEAALEIPGRLLNERWAKDYKTALTFYQEFCTAAAVKDEATCLKMLSEQAEVLAYFRQSGDVELLRVNALVAAFEEALDTMKDKSPFPRPILSEKYCTPARMQALEPFFTALPALKSLLLDTK
ncbi:MAG: hypothetical protein IKW48_01820 [Akkermansia sp.]|nr:hypothetical protein [Akkermansia sp.]